MCKKQISFFPFSFEDLNLKVLFNYLYFKREEWEFCDEKSRKQKREKANISCSWQTLQAEGWWKAEFSIKIPETELSVLQIFEFKTYTMGQNLIWHQSSGSSTQVWFQSLTVIKSGINKWRDSKPFILMPYECLCCVDNTTCTT